MRLIVLICATVLIVSCETKTTLKGTNYSDSLKKSNSVARKNDKELSESLEAINLESYYNKVEFSADFDSLNRRKLFLGHVYIIDVIRSNNRFTIKGASDKVLAHYIFDLRCDSTDAIFVRQNSVISLEFYSDAVQKVFRDTSTPLLSNTLPIYHISGRIIKAIKPLQ
jgi:hypothetical protein